MKAEKRDIDMYVLAVQNNKLEMEQRHKAYEQDTIERGKQTRRELDLVKQEIDASLSKKADYNAFSSLKNDIG